VCRPSSFFFAGPFIFSIFLLCFSTNGIRTLTKKVPTHIDLGKIVSTWRESSEVDVEYVEEEFNLGFLEEL
jgi:hypothetical protein